MTLPTVALTQALEAANRQYHGRLTDLREQVAAWLEYVPHTFPHYTRHTVAHSDEILGQLSQLLFTDGVPEAPVVRLSATELYVLSAAAYLHDVGMVVADREKAEILGSTEWRAWTTGGGGARRWAEIKALRDGATPADPAVRHFLADVQTRFLVAEFVRRVHHLRAKQVLGAHHERLGNPGFGDAALLRTIGDVCVGHGLRTQDLEDPERYPHRRTIRGDQVNVRFLTVLLRLGDLLDMSSARACPLLLSAASPLPPDSLGHWSQYERVVHRVTAPDRIEVTAECETQDEHRLLQDWCTWLADESRAAQLVMAHATRHGGWRAPRATIDGTDSTIRIRPAPDARYTPSRWTFELDADAILQRLSRDVYQYPASFVRELLQNALDATRTRMYDDMQAVGLMPPRIPSRAPADWRARYVLRISLDEVEVDNPLSGERERKQRVTVDDAGTGMDLDVIRRFLLQVGRSFYTSPDFRDRYPFVPTSRFGIGFLSVFAVSDHIEVETYNPTSRMGDDAVHLVLTGPRSYLLTSRGTRSVAGTRVGVRLREAMKAGELTELLRHWCRRVEFPVIVVEGGRETTIEAQEVGGFSPTAVTDRGEAVCAVTAFPVESDLLDGEVYIPSWTDGHGESWAARDRVETHVLLQPTADVDALWPSPLVCLHGVNVADPRFARYRRKARLDHDRRLDSLAARVDVRGPTDAITLSRENLGHDGLRYERDLLLALEPTYERLLDAHLANTPLARGSQGWQYRQALIREFPLPTYWSTVPNTVRAFRAGEEVHRSVRDVQEAPRLTLIITPDDVSVHSLWDDLLVQARLVEPEELVLLGPDLKVMPFGLSWSLVQDRKPAEFRLRAGAHPEVVFGSTADALPVFGSDDGMDSSVFYLVDIDTPGVLCVSLERPSWYRGSIVLNHRHPFTQWVVQLDEARRRGDGRVSDDQFWRLLQLVRRVNRRYTQAESINSFVGAWRETGNLKPDLLPPEAALSPSEFLGDLRWLAGGRRRRGRR